MKATLFTGYLLAALVLVPLEAQAVPKPLSKAELAQAQSKLKALDFLEVQFTQANFSKLRGKARNSKGRASFSQPGKFRWVIEDAGGEEVIYNGSTLWEYKPAEKTAVKYSAVARTSKDIDNLTKMILNTEKLFETYDVDKAFSENQVIDLELLPKSSPDIERVLLRISVRDERSYVKSVKIMYKTGNYWSIDFKNPRFKAIEASRFEFTPPADVKVSNIK